MNGSEKAGSGRGNYRKRPFRRRDKDNDYWDERDITGSGSTYDGDSGRNMPRSSERSFGGQSEKRNQNRGSLNRPQANSRQQWPPDNQNRQNRANQPRKGGETRGGGERTAFVERPRWIPPVINNEPLPNPDCPWCGKPIRDISSAITDRNTGAPVHFDCVAARIAETEKPENGDTVSYLGGGRFGIISCSGGENRNFKIKKIIEWENNDKKAEWRLKISDHYTVT